MVPGVGAKVVPGKVRPSAPAMLLGAESAGGAETLVPGLPLARLHGLAGHNRLLAHGDRQHREAGQRGEVAHLPDQLGPGAGPDPGVPGRPNSKPPVESPARPSRLRRPQPLELR